MAHSRFKGSKINEPFVAIVRSVFDCPEFHKLSPYACKLLLDLVSQYRGDNNGDLTCAWAKVKDRGWRSKSTLSNAKKELIKAGFVYVIRATLSSGALRAQGPLV